MAVKEPDEHVATSGKHDDRTSVEPAVIFFDFF